MSSATQHALTEWSSKADTETIETNKTVCLPLEASYEKRSIVQACIDQYTEMARFAYDIMPSFKRYHWGTKQHTARYRRLVEEFGDDRFIYAHSMQEAGWEAAQTFDKWNELGGGPNWPRKRSDSFIRLKGLQISDIVYNDDHYAVSLKLDTRTNGDTWFKIESNPYTTEYLEGIVDGYLEQRSGELRLEDGQLTLNLVVRNESIERYLPDEVTTVVGVDLNEDPIVAAAVYDSEDDDVIGTLHERSAEFKHHLNRIDRKRSEQQSRYGSSATELDHHRENYTEHYLDTASSKLIDFASEHECVIALEDLVHLRENTDNHDWPYYKLKEMIEYKADNAGIPIVFVDPSMTSQTCSMCGCEDPDARDRHRKNVFSCECGYEPNADVNAAINIAKKATSDL